MNPDRRKQELLAFRVVMCVIFVFAFGAAITKALTGEPRGAPFHYLLGFAIVAPLLSILVSFLESEILPTKIALIAGKIEDIFATIFRQNVLTRFEQAVFSRRQVGRLTPEAIGDLWFEANGRYYGDAVEMAEGYRWGWSYIPHFIHSRFYCYSYIFGELLVLSLYRIYREEGRSFVPKYVELLEAGGSDSPGALLKPLGVDFHQAEFWQRGFDEIRGLVRRVAKLIEQIVQ